MGNVGRLADLFGWGSPRKDLCGRQLVTWAFQDQQDAERQAQLKKLNDTPAIEEQKEKAVHDAIHELREEMFEQQTRRDAEVMERVRAISRRPQTTNNATLCMQIFGVQWNGAVSMCERMGLEPKKVGK